MDHTGGRKHLKLGVKHGADTFIGYRGSSS